MRALHSDFTIPYDYLSDYNNMLIAEGRGAQVMRIRNMILSSQARYETVQLATDVPWQIIGCLHYRESDLDFTKHLYNGDPLTGRTTHEPKGRPIQDPVNGKKYTWEESAADALKYDGTKRGYGLDSVPGWSVNEALYFFEKYNGFGYRKYHNMKSPYLWSGTNYYTVGKYDNDGHFNPKLKDAQVGCAPLLKALEFTGS